VLSVEARPRDAWEQESERAGKLTFDATITTFLNQRDELVVTVRSVRVVTEARPVNAVGGPVMTPARGWEIPREAGISRQPSMPPPPPLAPRARASASNLVMNRAEFHSVHPRLSTAGVMDCVWDRRVYVTWDRNGTIQGGPG
jgi:hypothetical protein